MSWTLFPGRSALALALLYAVIGSLWILLSDRGVEALFRDPASIIAASMLKGWFYVGVTSLLLYFLVGRLLTDLRAAHQREIASYAEKQRTLDLLNAVADNTDDAIFAQDLNGRYLLLNAAAGRFIGKTEAEVLGRDDTAIFPAEQAEMLMAIGRRILTTGQIETNEEVLDTALGRRTFLATKGPLRDDGKRIFGTFGVSRDITARKRAEEDLQARNTELERFNRASVGRELDMIELKRRINALERELGRAPPFPLDFDGGGKPSA